MVSVSVSAYDNSFVVGHWLVLWVTSSPNDSYKNGNRNNPFPFSTPEPIRSHWRRGSFFILLQFAFFTPFLQHISFACLFLLNFFLCRKATLHFIDKMINRYD